MGWRKIFSLKSFQQRQQTSSYSIGYNSFCYRSVVKVIERNERHKKARNAERREKVREGGSGIVLWDMSSVYSGPVSEKYTPPSLGPLVHIPRLLSLFITQTYFRLHFHLYAHQIENFLFYITPMNYLRTNKINHDTHGLLT